MDTFRSRHSELAMTDLQWLTGELRLLFEYGEHEHFDKSAQRIIEGLERFNTEPRPLSLVDALDQAGVDYTRIKMVNVPTCDHVYPDGAMCGCDVRDGVCEWGHQQ